MTCRADDFNPTASLNMDTWSGSDKVGGNPVLDCSIDDKSEPTHFVEVKNHKTYNRIIYVTGFIRSTLNRARFTGPSCFVKSEVEWEADDTVGHTPGNEVLTFKDVKISQKRAGRETIKVKVEYEDPWNPGEKKRGDRASNPLEFRVDLI